MKAMGQAWLERRRTEISYLPKMKFTERNIELGYFWNTNFWVPSPLPPLLSSNISVGRGVRRACAAPCPRHMVPFCRKGHRVGGGAQGRGGGHRVGPRLRTAAGAGTRR